MGVVYKPVQNEHAQDRTCINLVQTILNPVLLTTKIFLFWTHSTYKYTMEND